MSLTVKLPIDLEREVERRRREEGFDPEAFIIAALREQFHFATSPNTAPFLEEERLLSEIESLGKGLPDLDAKRYGALRRKQSNHTLSAEEHSEFTALSDRLVALNNQRLERIIALARIRRQPVDDTLKSFRT